MRLFFIFLALVIAVAAGMAFWLLSAEEEAPVEVVVQPAPVAPVQVQDATILVARQDIPVGKRITEQDIDRQAWPSHLVHEEFIRQGGEAGLIDMVARTPFQAREPFAVSRLANPNDPSFLAAQLPEGKRAVTIPVDAISGINGFISPGDRVDVLINHEIGLGRNFVSGMDIQATGPGQELSDRPKITTTQPLPRESRYQVPLLMTSGKDQARPMLEVTEVLLSNVRILAVGQQSYQYENATNVPTNVTLEVTDLEAQKLRHAENGSLSLALRSLNDAEELSVPRPVADADMTRLTPPSYFPYLYTQGDYGVEFIDLDEIDYGAPQEDIGGSGQVTIIRGVEKETSEPSANLAPAPAAPGSGEAVRDAAPPPMGPDT